MSEVSPIRLVYPRDFLLMYSNSKKIDHSIRDKLQPHLSPSNVKGKIQFKSRVRNTSDKDLPYLSVSKTPCPKKRGVLCSNRTLTEEKQTAKRNTLEVVSPLYKPIKGQNNYVIVQKENIPLNSNVRTKVIKNEAVSEKISRKGLSSRPARLNCLSPTYKPTVTYIPKSNPTPKEKEPISDIVCTSVPLAIKDNTSTVQLVTKESVPNDKNNTFVEIPRNQDATLQNVSSPLETPKSSNPPSQPGSILSPIFPRAMTSPFKSPPNSLSKSPTSASKSSSRPITPLDEQRLLQRQKQIDYGYRTVGYLRYRLLVSKDQRKPEYPRTPKKTQGCSKRSWDGQLKKWRRDLHQWDPDNVDAFRALLNSDLVVSIIAANPELSEIVDIVREKLDNPNTSLLVDEFEFVDESTPSVEDSFTVTIDNRLQKVARTLVFN